MDVPLALHNIGIRQGLKDSKRKSSTISQETDVVGLSALIVFLLAIQTLGKESFIQYY